MAKRQFIDYTLFAEAWLLLAIARAMLVFVPFKKIAPLLGRQMYEVPADNEEKRREYKKSEIGLAILRGAKFSPWRAKCFEQAIAGKLMLKMRGVSSTVYFGVLKNVNNELNAHAWVKSNKQIVTGGPDVNKYTVVSWFGS